MDETNIIIGIYYEKTDHSFFPYAYGRLLICPDAGDAT